MKLIKTQEVRMVPMKKIMKILLVVMMFLSFFGCRKKEEQRYPERNIDLPDELPSFDEDAIAIHYQTVILIRK